ncbi:MAG: DUF4399 domain-containing protein [Acidimicrobiales bacterium]
MTKRWLVAVTVVMALVASACGSDDSPVADPKPKADDAASVSVRAPNDGATVARRFDVAMLATNFTVEPAGEVSDGHGHLHVMIDTPCVAVGEVVPKDTQHLHFGKGQSSTQLFLEAGKHKLCLQAADGVHTALDLTDEISVTVDSTLPFVSLGVPAGETVTSPVSLTMTAENVKVAPAGTVEEGSGHFHVMIDTACVAEGEVVPKDDQHVHLGDGSAAKELGLAAGEHTLCLQLADGAHVALPLTHKVTITVA